MPYRLRLLGLVAVVLGAVTSLALFASSRPPHPPLPVVPATQHVLIGAPDPSGPVLRDRFVDDPRGQIETLAAGDHLVAWSVRSPADRLGSTNEDVDRELPLQFPERSQLVIVDERGGAPLMLDLRKRYVQSLLLVHGAAGEPQLAVRHCGSRKAASCTAELLTLGSGAPAKLLRRSQGQAAELALAGEVDEGRRLRIGQRAKGVCLPQLSVGAADGSNRRTLPPLPTDGGGSLYPTCTGLVGAQLYGRYAFATVSGENTEFGFDGHVVYALDVAAGTGAGWHHVATPYRYSDGSTGYALGPAIAGDALFYEEIDTEDGDGTPYSLGRSVLPNGEKYTEGDPVTPKDATENVCAIAATLDAVYELDNPRCVPFPSFTSGPSAIRRLSGKDYGLEVPADG